MKYKVLYSLIAIFVFISCKKDDGNKPDPEPDAFYVNTIDGSTWNYHEVNKSGPSPVESDYTITSTSRDTSVGPRNYHIYNYSYGRNQYLYLSGHSYFQYDSIPGMNLIFEREYLRDDAAVGASWTQNLNVPVPGLPGTIPIIVTYKIVEKGISRSVNSKSYSNVIHVSTTISSIGLPSDALTSDIHSYYAEDYGLIENTTKININFLGVVQKVDLETTLTSANLR